MSGSSSETVEGPEKIKNAQVEVQNTNIGELSGFFRLLAGDTRIKILVALSKGELCVCDLSDVLEMSVSAISHQLKELREGGLVKYRREANNKHRYYSLEIEHLEPILTYALEHIHEIHHS
ncbi:MAG: ArsR/SmtB family transcription factor [Candidatus Heimdallarchaeota archaeon]